MRRRNSANKRRCCIDSNTWILLTCDSPLCNIIDDEFVAVFGVILKTCMCKVGRIVVATAISLDNHLN